MSDKTTAMQKASHNGMSLGALAVHLGVGRERMYHMLKRGKLRVVPTSAGQMVPPEECERLKMSMTTVRVPSGKTRTVFEEV
jgi:hypothetical protein